MTSENTVVQRVKIVRNDSIGEYSWDSSDENVNDGLGVNEWSESDIMKLLNPGFEKESFNNSLYWNGQSGNCYTDRYNVFSSCSFSNNLNKSQNYIEDVFWNTGSNEGKYNYNGINVYQFYEIERSNRIPNYCKQHGIGNACNDNVSRTYLWKGKVGLIYPSDFGYATIGNETTTRLTCQQTNMHDWNNFQDCSNNNWLNLSEKQWTITPCSTEEFSLVDAFSIRDFIVREDWIRGSMGIRPVVFLKTNTFIKTGNGSIDHSYELSLVY